MEWTEQAVEAVVRPARSPKKKKSTSDSDVNGLASSSIGLPLSLGPLYALSNTHCLIVGSVDGHFGLSSQWPGTPDKRPHLNDH